MSLTNGLNDQKTSFIGGSDFVRKYCKLLTDQLAFPVATLQIPDF